MPQDTLPRYGTLVKSCERFANNEPDQRKLGGTHSAVLMEKSLQGGRKVPYVYKYAEPAPEKRLSENALEAISIRRQYALIREAITTDLYRFIVSPQFMPKVCVVAATDGKLIALASKKIPSFESAKTHGAKIQFKNAITEKEWAALFTSAFALAEYDLNAGNFGVDENNQLVRIDSGDSLMFCSSRITPHFSLKHPETMFPTAIFCQTVSYWDIQNLPDLQDRKTANFYLPPPKNSLDKKAFLNWKYFYFTKTLLLNDDIIKTIAMDHTRDEKKFEELNHHTLSLFSFYLKNLKEQLLSTPGYREFLEKTWNNESEFQREFQNEFQETVEAYNRAVSTNAAGEEKKNKLHRRVSIEKLTENLKCLRTEASEKQKAALQNPPEEFSLHFNQLLGRIKKEHLVIKENSNTDNAEKIRVLRALVDKLIFSLRRDIAILLKSPSVSADKQLEIINAAFLACDEETKAVLDYYYTTIFFPAFLGEHQNNITSSDAWSEQIQKIQHANTRILFYKEQFRAQQNNAEQKNALPLLTKTLKEIAGTYLNQSHQADALLHLVSIYSPQDSTRDDKNTFTLNQTVIEQFIAALLCCDQTKKSMVALFENVITDLKNYFYLSAEESLDFLKKQLLIPVLSRSLSLEKRYDAVPCVIGIFYFIEEKYSEETINNLLEIIVQQHLQEKNAEAIILKALQSMSDSFCLSFFNAIKTKNFQWTPVIVDFLVGKMGENTPLSVFQVITIPHPDAEHEKIIKSFCEKNPERFAGKLYFITNTFLAESQKITQIETTPCCAHFFSKKPASTTPVLAKKCLALFQHFTAEFTESDLCAIKAIIEKSERSDVEKIIFRLFQPAMLTPTKTYANKNTVSFHPAAEVKITIQETVPQKTHDGGCCVVS